MISASRVDLIIIAVYLVLMIVVGVVMAFFNKSSSDFCKSGNKMPWWLSDISFFMTIFSVYTFTGAAGLAYRAPSIALLMYFSNSVAMVLSVLFLASCWRRSRASTAFSYMS